MRNEKEKSYSVEEYEAIVVCRRRLSLSLCEINATQGRSGMQADRHMGESVVASFTARSKEKVLGKMITYSYSCPFSLYGITHDQDRY